MGRSWGKFPHFWVRFGLNFDAFEVNFDTFGSDLGRIWFWGEFPHFWVCCSPRCSVRRRRASSLSCVANSFWCARRFSSAVSSFWNGQRGSVWSLRGHSGLGTVTGGQQRSVLVSTDSPACARSAGRRGSCGPADPRPRPCPAPPRPRPRSGDRNREIGDLGKNLGNLGKKLVNLGKNFGKFRPGTPGIPEIPRNPTHPKSRKTPQNPSKNPKMNQILRKTPLEIGPSGGIFPKFGVLGPNLSSP